MNYQKMWFKLKGEINSKNSHGKNELLGKMMEIEINESESSDSNSTVPSTLPKIGVIHRD